MVMGREVEADVRVLTRCKHPCRLLSCNAVLVHQSRAALLMQIAAAGGALKGPQKRELRRHVRAACAPFPFGFACALSCLSLRLRPSFFTQDAIVTHLWLSLWLSFSLLCDPDTLGPLAYAIVTGRCAPFWVLCGLSWSRSRMRLRGMTSAWCCPVLV